MKGGERSAERDGTGLAADRGAGAGHGRMLGWGSWSSSATISPDVTFANEREHYEVRHVCHGSARVKHMRGEEKLRHATVVSVEGRP